MEFNRLKFILRKLLFHQTTNVFLSFEEACRCSLMAIIHILPRSPLHMYSYTGTGRDIFAGFKANSYGPR